MYVINLLKDAKLINTTIGAKLHSAWLFVLKYVLDGSIIVLNASAIFISPSSIVFRKKSITNSKITFDNYRVSVLKNYRLYIKSFATLNINSSKK